MVKKCVLITLLSSLTLMLVSEKIVFNVYAELPHGDDCENDNCGLRIVDPPTPPTNPEFDLVTYFQNLFNYSPLNSYGSCGYVALSQYLSYYDTFFNDSIIAAQYDRKNEFAFTYNAAISDSPGVLRSAYPSSPTDLYNYVIDNKNSDFQAKLMYTFNTIVMNRTSSQYSYMVGLNNYQSILNNLYTGTIPSVTSLYYLTLGNYINDYYVQEGMKDFIKTKLDLGEPVIVQIVGGNYANNNWQYNHAAVAYYYDEDGIHCNMGNSSLIVRNDVALPDLTFSLFYRAAYINFSSFGHQHSNNYVIAGKSFCGCGTHQHHMSYVYYNATKHRATCSECGYNQLEYHVFNQNNICQGCGYVG